MPGDPIATARATVVVDILDAIEAREGEIADLVVGEVAAGISDYADSPERDAALAGVRAHGLAHIRRFLRCAREGRPPEPRDLDLVDDMIRERIAQGIPVAAVLHSFRIGHRATWDAIQREAERHPEGWAAAVSLTRPSMDYIDAVSTRVAETYIAERQHTVAAADRARRDLLDLLLAGHEDAPLAATAAGVALQPGRPHVLVLARADDERAARALAGQLGPAFAAHHPLIVLARPGVTAILRAGPADLPAVVAQCVAAATAVRDRTQRSARIGISLAVPTLGDVPSALRQATSALGLTTAASPVVGLSQVPIVDYLVAAADETVAELVPAAVRELVHSDAAFDRALVDTVLAYVDAGLNVKRAAATLPAHANTVHHRLRRLSERTGTDLHDVTQLMDLVLAVRVLRATDGRGPASGAAAPPPGRAQARPATR